MPKPSVLVVDDNDDMLQLLQRYLEDHGFDVETAVSGEKALAAFKSCPRDVVLTDLRMKGLDGLDVLEELKAIVPDVAVIIMTAFGNVESAVDAVQRGAFHYVTKPFKMAVVRVLIERAARERCTRDENRQLHAAFGEQFAAQGLVGNSSAMREIRRIIQQVANAPTPVLITGETGTGKEMVARALHVESSRREGPFVVVNCAALPEAMFESELFGHVRGAFTGATKQRAGLFCEADGGTLLLDEVGDLPATLQMKVLRALESGEIRALGADSVETVAVRCVATTQRDLKVLTATGQFREDLFFRLAGVPVSMPPLRARAEDIPALLEHFATKLGQWAVPARTIRFSPASVRVLEQYPWPGNVRELENMVERLYLTSFAQEIDAGRVRDALATQGAADTFDWIATSGMKLEELERRYISAVVRRTGGSKIKAAEILGVDVSTLYRRGKTSRA